MDLNPFAKFGNSSVDLSQILKIASQEMKKMRAVRLKGEEIFRFFLIADKEQLSLYKTDRKSDKLTSFGPAFCDFMIESEEEGEEFEVIGFQELNIDVLINPATMDVCVRQKHKKSGETPISIEEINRRLFDGFPELEGAAGSDIDKFEERLTDTPLIKLVNETFGVPNTSPFVRFDSEDDLLFCQVNETRKRFNHEKQLKTAVLGFQFILRFFIDTGSRIDIDDPSWMYLFAFDNQNIIGFLSAYHFHNCTLEFKLRVSQLIVLTPFRNRKIGYTLLQLLYQQFLPDIRCTMITAEDPNDSFVKLQFRIWISMLKSAVFDSEDFKAISDHFEEEPIAKVKTMVASRVKCSKANAITIVDAFLLHKQRSKGDLPFIAYMRKKVEDKIQKEKEGQQRKIKQKFISIDSKIVSRFKIEKLYKELAEENGQEPVEDITLRMTKFIQSLMPMFC